MNKSYQFSTDTGLGSNNDESGATGDDIELEYEIDPSILNAKYSGFKKQYEEEEDEEEEEPSDEDYDDSTIEEQEIKETVYDQAEVDDDVDDEYESVRGENYQEIFLKSILRIIYKIKENWVKILIYFLLFITNLGLLSYFNSGDSQNSSDIVTNIRNFGDLTKSIQNLQWQINDLNSKNKLKLQDFKHYLDLKIDEFQLKFNSIDDDLNELKFQNSKIIERIDKINVGDIQISNDKLPVLLDEDHNIKIIPEFASYLQQKFQEIIDGELTDSKFQLNYEKFIANHVEEMINSKIGFMNKEEILSLITLQFQENKKRLINEIRNLTKLNNNKEIPSRLIPQITKKSNGKINYGQSISGARIINYLTSKTFKPRYKSSIWDSLISNSRSNTIEEIDDELYQASPFIVVTPNEGYWRSSVIKDTQLSIKFLEPIYMNEIAYNHGDMMVINGAIITSCPKHMSLYVQVDEADELKELGFNEEIQGHFRVSRIEYDVNSLGEQVFNIPEEVKKYLTKSIIIVANDNYGNEFFTSFYKIRVNGMTRFDLYSIKKLMNNGDISDTIKNKFKSGTRSFGEDVVV